MAANDCTAKKLVLKYLRKHKTDGEFAGTISCKPYQGGPVGEIHTTFPVSSPLPPDGREGTHPALGGRRQHRRIV